MSKIYKIHPAIGFARLGNHTNAFFVGPESPGASGKEIAQDDSESDVKLYKDGGLIKRQAARFRVYEYETDATGNVNLVGEVKGDQVQIDWRVELVNRKAALDHSPATGHPSGPRNLNVTDRSTLVIRDSQPRSVSGRKQQGPEFHGSFLGKDVYLGELRTDNFGRLLVLGGRGFSESVPPGANLPEFANNDGWHDDVSDGPVTATLSFAGQPPFAVHQPAWVVVAPPDFAPTINGIVTLYEVALQAAIDKGMRTPDPKPSFSRHIKPIIERAVNLRWVNNWNRWNAFVPLQWNLLADTTNASAALRKSLGTRLMNPGLRDFVVPAYLSEYIQQWINGDFLGDLSDPIPTESEPTNLDSCALQACVGAGFFPGIESSITLRDKDIYVEPFRLNHANVAKVFPGCLTEIMAVPWQADFNDCEGGIWWPSQRPDIAMLDRNRIPASQADWANPIPDHQGMVDNAQRLGFIVPTGLGPNTVFVEAERDPTLNRV
jgi:L-lysine epsilon oxidase-like protein